MPGIWYILNFYCNSTLINPKSYFLGHSYWKLQLCWMFHQHHETTEAIVSLAHPSTAPKSTPGPHLPISANATMFLSITQIKNPRFLLTPPSVLPLYDCQPSPFSLHWTIAWKQALVTLIWSFSGLFALFSQSLFFDPLSHSIHCC